MNGLHIFCVPMSFQDFATHFLDEVFFQDMVHAYQWSSSLGRHLGCFGHFVLMCSSLTFLSHSDSTSFFFLLISFGEFWQEIYVNMWGHYGSRIMGVFLVPLHVASNLTIDILWWCKPCLYGGWCHLLF